MLSARLRLLATVASALAAPSLHAQVAATGTFDPPGPGDEIDYEITFATIPIHPANPWTDLLGSIRMTNRSDETSTFFACAMVRILSDEDVTMPQHYVHKRGNQWICRQDGTAKRPPSYHFGCHYVSIPPGGTFVLPLTGRVPGWLSTELLSSIYWDTLQAVDSDGNPCSPPRCPMLPGYNVNLSPLNWTSPESWIEWISNTFNLWGGNWFVPERLVALDPDPPPGRGRVRRVCYVESGNMVTMTRGGEYAVRLRGSFEGAPAGATLAFILPDGTRSDFEAPGRPVEIDIPTSIPLDPDALMLIRYDGPPLPNGSHVSLRLDVISDEEGEVYPKGAVLHKIALEDIGDDEPPRFDEVRATPVEGGTLIEVSMSDRYSRPAGVVVEFSAPGQLVSTSAALALDGDLTQGEDRVAGRFTGLIPRECTRFVVHGVDGEGNRARSRPFAATGGAWRTEPEYPLFGQ